MAPLPSSEQGRRAPLSERLRPTRGELRAAAILVLVLAVVGLLAGVIWSVLAPRLGFSVVRGSGGPVGIQTDPESEALIAADGWFAIIGAVLGVLTGLAVWSRRLSRGPVLVVALAIASLVGSLVAWRFGLWLGRHPTAGQVHAALGHVGAALHARLTLRAKGALFFQPFFAVLTVVVATGFSRLDDLRRPERRSPQVSSSRPAG